MGERLSLDSQNINYGVRVISESGQEYNIDSSVTALKWEEQEGQLAAKATVEVAAESAIDGESIRSILKLNRQVSILADWGGGFQPMFQGIIWDWDYTHAQKKSLSITVYDPMVRLQQSKDHKYFSAGMDTKAILGTICGDAGVPLNYKWAYSIAHEKKVFRQNAISDMIIELLDEVKKQKHAGYVMLYRDGTLEINGYGNNSDMYKFGSMITISTEDKLTQNNLVTRVKVLGKADDEGRSSVDAVVNGNLEYGVLQEIVIRDQDKELGTAKQEAQDILDERGEPEETVLATAPDVPFIRKGDAVEMHAGNLIGIFYVLGVSHDAFSRQMTMTLERQSGSVDTGANGVIGSDNGEGDTTEFKVGDAVILNGPVYADSYGSGKGRTFTDYQTTVSIVVDDDDRPCPYCVGGVGWVYPNEIKLA